MITVSIYVVHLVLETSSGDGDFPDLSLDDTKCQLDNVIITVEEHTYSAHTHLPSSKLQTNSFL